MLTYDVKNTCLLFFFVLYSLLRQTSERKEKNNSMEKIKMQLLADSLGVSRVTVWKVINNRSGVSNKTQALVRDALKKFQQSDSPAASQNSSLFKEVKSISLIASRMDTSVFWIRIVDQIVNEANKRGIRLNYIPIDIMNLSSIQLNTMLSPEQTDGVIIINLYSKKLISLLCEINIAKVFLDTIPEHDVSDLQGDLILLEGENTMKKITQNMVDKGCRKVGFIGDIFYAKTNEMRYNGFKQAMAKNNLPISPEYCLTAPMDTESYLREIGAFLDNLEVLPDAFVCVSDYVAFLTHNLLVERLDTEQIPRLSGYDNSKEFLLDHYGITTVNVQNAMLGKRLIMQALYRIENPNADFEEVLITPQILFRD